jgi:NitT/TauT family transport system permease protein
MSTDTTDLEQQRSDPDGASRATLPDTGPRREENPDRPGLVRRFGGVLTQVGQIGLGLGGLVVVWHLAVALLDVPFYILPPPIEVARTLVSEWPQLWEQTWVTLQESVGGYLLAIVVSVPLAILLTYSRLADRIFFPVLVVFQVIPKIALAPLFIIWLGFGMFPKVLISFLVAFFAIVVSTTVGLKSAKPEMIDLARSMGASTLEIFLKVRLPNSLPTFFGGLKVGVTLAVIGAIVGEFVGSGAGLGHLLIVAMAALNLPLVFSSILMMAAIGIVMYGAVEVTERIAIPWQRSQRLALQATA